MKAIRSKLIGLAATLPVGALVVTSSAAPPKRAAKPAVKVVPARATVGAGFEKEALPFVQKYCVSCHAGDSPAAGVSLDEYKTGAQAARARNLWDKVGQSVADKHMPPAGMPQPTQAERSRLVNWLQSSLSKADCNVKEPGAVTMRRLNRAEYNNTVRDLLGVDVRPADDFPNDDVGYGFDNIGDVLSISPLLMEKYLNAARVVARAAVFAPEDRVPVPPAKFGADRLTGDGGDYPDTGGRILFSAGDAGVDYKFPAPGTYLIRAVAFEQHAGPEAAEMEFKVGDKTLRKVRVRAREKNPTQFEAVYTADKAGVQRVAVAFTNDYYDDKSEDPKLKGDRNLIVQQVEVIPSNVTVERPKVVTNAQKQLLRAVPKDGSEAAKDAATRANLAAFLPRAYRRPATKAEIDRIAKIAARVRQAGASYERGMQTAVQAALVSPNFLFRVEPEPEKGKTKRPLSDYELASRLSYFLWTSMPDDTLLSLAGQGKLKDPAVLEQQAMRMLKDPRAKSLAENFAGQWLQLRKLGVVTPDSKQFPMFNDVLRVAMRTETEMTFQTIVNQDRSILEFLDSDWTYLNEPLARLYGNTEVKGDNFRLVKLQSGRRGGVVTQASILTVTSNPTRTSPVKRGKWVLENIFGTPPPPAPPNVKPLTDDENKGQPLTGTLRQRMEQHRNDPGCASCHSKMDPLGFGLENYDAIGAWRTTDGTNAVDAGGVLPDGTKFEGPGGLKKYLMANKGKFVRAFSERLLTYALGRGVEGADSCHVDAIAQEVTKGNYRFSTLVRAVVSSEPFRYKGHEGAQEAPAANPKVAAGKKSITPPAGRSEGRG